MDGKYLIWSGASQLVVYLGHRLLSAYRISTEDFISSGDLRSGFTQESLGFSKPPSNHLQTE